MSKESSARMLLESCALGYAAAVHIAARDTDEADAWLGAKDALAKSALGYAASCGQLDAAEQAELAALRRFRDGILGLRAEMSASVAPELDRPIETIDALLTMSFPVKVGP